MDNLAHVVFVAHLDPPFLFNPGFVWHPFDGDDGHCSAGVRHTKQHFISHFFSKLITVLPKKPQWRSEIFQFGCWTYSIEFNWSSGVRPHCRNASRFPMVDVSNEEIQLGSRNNSWLPVMASWSYQQNYVSSPGLFVASSANCMQSGISKMRRLCLRG